MRKIYAILAILAFAGLPAMAQEGPRKAILDELNAAPKPRGQNDLDTRQLASAHRERAPTLEERTNGLWQSWVVAICQGCGVQEQLHSKKDVEDLMGKSAWLKTGPRIDLQAARTNSGPRTVSPTDTLEGRSPGLTTGPNGRSSEAKALEWGLPQTVQ